MCILKAPPTPDQPMLCRSQAAADTGTCLAQPAPVAPAFESRVALPGRFLRERLHQLQGAPEWTAYLPAKLHEEHCVSSLPVTPWGPARVASSPAVAGGDAAPATSWWFGRAWALSRDPAGCREVQRVLDSDDEVERLALVAELRGHVCEGVRCPHANYVFQKALETLRPGQLDFIVEELGSKGPEGIVQASRHKYGCRIVQRLLEHGSLAQTESIVNALFGDVLGNCLHPYGNYAMQKVLEHGPLGARRFLVKAIQQDVATLGMDTYGSSVLSKTMACSSRNEQLALVRAMLAERGLMLAMSQTRQGNMPVKAAMKLLVGEELQNARRQLGLGRRDRRGALPQSCAAGQ